MSRRQSLRLGLCHRQWAIINCVETVKRTRHKATMLVARVSNMSDSNDSVSLEEISHVSRALGNAAELLQDTCTDSEKLRLAILLGCIKLGLRKRSRGPATKEVLPQLITTQKQLARAISLSKQTTRVAVDCEGCQLSHEGRLCLVLIPVKASDAQGAKAHNQCFLFDMVKELPGATPFLKQLIENPRIVKVLHDCRQDAAALLVQKGISLRNVYDTQVAYGLVSCWRSQLGSQQTIRRLGLQDLLKRVGLRAHQSKSDVRAKMAEDPNLWQHRPLASELQQYAAADVSQLLAVADRSSAMLGTVGQEVVRVLSQASCQLKLPVMPGTQVTNLEKLPHNVQTELRFYNNADGVCCDPVFTVLSPADQASISAEHPSTDDFADTPDERSNADDMADILELVPETIRAAINAHLDSMNSLYPIRVTGIVADVGRPVRIRFDSTQKGTREYSLSVDLDIAEAVQALKGAQKQLQTGRPADYFGVRNRMSLRGSLHRISAMKGDQGDIQGLTYRVGRHISGVATMLMDKLAELATAGNAANRQVQSCCWVLLVLGRQLCCEIAGGGQVPHSCIGSARRMTGTTKQSKHEVLQEAVTNHGPEVIVVDEVYNAKEVAAMADIARCGVAMVATVHGTSLQTLLDNRTLNNLLGGKQEVIVGDQQASNDRKGPSGTRKTRQERREAPLFATVIESEFTVINQAMSDHQRRSLVDCNLCATQDA
ncbi:hypothetical protein WJX82_003776 [Trebouxia sp. C0006]